MSKKTTIIGVNEILGAFLSNDVKGDVDKFKADSKAYAAEKYGTDLSLLDVTVVENSNDTMHLGLPYYSHLDATNADVLNDDAVEIIAGGEIIVTAAFLGAIGGSVALGVASNVGALPHQVKGARAAAAAGETA